MTVAVPSELVLDRVPPASPFARVGCVQDLAVTGLDVSGESGGFRNGLREISVCVAAGIGAGNALHTVTVVANPVPFLTRPHNLPIYTIWLACVNVDLAVAYEGD